MQLVGMRGALARHPNRGCSRWTPEPTPRRPHLVDVGGESGVDLLVQQEVTGAALPGHPCPGADGLRVAVCGNVSLDGHALAPCPGHHLASTLGGVQRLLDQEGREGLRRLRGSFLLAHVDPARRQLLLFRSATSTHSLYHRLVRGALHWSTDPRDLFVGGRPSLPDVDAELLPAAIFIADYSWERTWFRGVRRVPTGTCVVFREGRLVADQVDGLTVDEDNEDLPLADAAERWRELLAASVRRSIDPECRPLALISGGIDSGSVAHAVAALPNPKGALHHTWSTVSSLREEPVAAREAAEYLGLRFILTDVGSSVERGGDLLDVQSSSAIPSAHEFFRPMLAVGSTTAENGYDTIVTGHLADALMYGSWPAPIAAELRSRRGGIGALVAQRRLLEWYRVRERRPRLRSVIAYARASERAPAADMHVSRRGRAKQLDLAHGWLTKRARQAVDEDGSGFASPPGDLPPHRAAVYHAFTRQLNQVAELDTAFTRDALLPCGVSQVHPYADRDLAEFALSLGDRHRARIVAGRDVRKLTIRVAYLDRLPASVVSRVAYHPYAGVTMRFCNLNQPQLRAVLGKDSILAQMGIIEPAGVAATLGRQSVGRGSAQHVLRAAGFELWLRNLRSSGSTDAMLEREEARAGLGCR